MAGMIIGSLSNILLDYLFIYPLNLGMVGAALATATAPLISMGILSTDEDKTFPQHSFLDLFSRCLLPDH